jgi:hypothetical protein
VLAAMPSSAVDEYLRSGPEALDGEEVAKRIIETAQRDQIKARTRGKRLLPAGHPRPIADVIIVTAVLVEPYFVMQS